MYLPNRRNGLLTFNHASHTQFRYKSIHDYNLLNIGFQNMSNQLHVKITQYLHTDIKNLAHIFEIMICYLK